MHLTVEYWGTSLKGNRQSMKGHNWEKCIHTLPGQPGPLNTQFTALSFQGHTLPWEGESKHLFEAGAEVVGRVVRFTRTQGKPISGLEKRCKWHGGRPAEPGKGAEMLGPVPAPPERIWSTPGPRAGLPRKPSRPGQAPARWQVPEVGPASQVSPRAGPCKPGGGGGEGQVPVGERHLKGRRAAVAERSTHGDAVSPRGWTQCWWTGLLRPPAPQSRWASRPPAEEVPSRPPSSLVQTTARAGPRGPVTWARTAVLARRPPCFPPPPTGLPLVAPPPASWRRPPRTRRARLRPFASPSSSASGWVVFRRPLAGGAWVEGFGAFTTLSFVARRGQTVSRC